MQSSQPTPFRLTRNISTFLTPFLVDGVFSSVMAATNACMHRCVAFSPLSLYLAFSPSLPPSPQSHTVQLG